MDVLGVLHDERAVSPVVGTILMVAITVILAAVIGAAVFGVVGDLGETAPQASFQWDANLTADNDTLTVTHAGGEALQAGNVNYSVTNARAYLLADTVDPPSGYEVDGIYTVSFKGDAYQKGGTVQAGDSDLLNKTDFYSPSDYEASNLYLNASTVRLVWSGGERSAVLSGWQGPDAEA